MPETLTESFCERCGTRYTFESAAPKTRRFGRIKVLGKGVVNFVTNDDTSFDEAFAVARSDEMRAVTIHQLDAFHKTFQFCMSCRQYTCATCWNEPEARCLSCAPMPGRELSDATVASLTAETIAAPMGLDPALRLDFVAGVPDASIDGHDDEAAIEAAAWPTADLPAAEPGGSEELPAEPQAVDAIEEIDADVAQAVADAERARAEADRAKAAALAASAAETNGHDERAAAAAAATTSMLARHRPTTEPAQSPEMTEAEQRIAASAAEVAASEPAAATGEPGDQPPRLDRIETPTWRVVAPDAAPVGGPGPGAPSTPDWPTPQTTPPPQWPMPTADEAPSWPAPAIAPDQSTADLWVVSSQDLLRQPEARIQACNGCGLPLSATARFCRRCGNRQH